MERLQNLSAVNTNTIEGRLFMAALAKLTTESQRDKTPDEVIEQCHDLAEHMYKDAGDLPAYPTKMQTFTEALSTLINQHSMEKGSNTPDFILADYLHGCLVNYNNALTLRDKWFGITPWENRDQEGLDQLDKEIAESRQKKITGLKKDGVVYERCNNCPDSAEMFVTLEERPIGSPTINKSVTGINWAIENGYEPIYQ